MIKECQLKSYKENEYFRFIYDKHIYRLNNRIKCEDKDIISYIRFFSNGNSFKDDVLLYKSKFGDSFEVNK